MLADSNICMLVTCMSSTNHTIAPTCPQHCCSYTLAAITTWNSQRHETITRAWSLLVAAPYILTLVEPCAPFYLLARCACVFGSPDTSQRHPFIRIAADLKCRRTLIITVNRLEKLRCLKTYAWAAPSIMRLPSLSKCATTFAPALVIGKRNDRLPCTI